MDPRNPSLSLELEQLENQVLDRPLMPASRLAGTGRVQFPPQEDRASFRQQLDQLLTTFDVPDARQDVPMKEFLTWRMRSLWFLYRYLGSNHPYTSEFLSTVEREADPHSNGRLVIAAQAILEALSCDLDAGFLFRDDDGG
jgi:hypothetical protein